MGSLQSVLEIAERSRLLTTRAVTLDTSGFAAVGHHNEGIII
jgi:hypothetical protein